MAKRVIRGELSVKGIQSIIDQLQDYKKDLHRRAELLCQRLAEAGLTVAQSSVGESPLGKYVSVRISMDAQTAGCRAMLIATGQTKTSEWQTKEGVKSATISCLAMIEFGSGVAKNKEINPKATDFGMGPGTFPNATHSFDPSGWWWKDADTGEWKHSSGIKATMPMYNASVAIRQQVAAITKEVFD